MAKSGADGLAARVSATPPNAGRSDILENPMQQTAAGEKGMSSRFDGSDDQSEAMVERLEGTHGRPFPRQFSMSAPKITNPVGSKAPSDFSFEGKKRKSKRGGSGLALKKPKRGKAIDAEMPPTPYGCEWIRNDQGWNLWRCWSEKDESTGERVKKNRLAGHISNEAWQIMKEYDYETFISIIGQRLRRYGKR